MADFRYYSGMDMSQGILHYGVGHEDGGHSGRYKWGTGDRPKQREESSSNAQSTKDSNTKGHKAKQKIANTVARPFMSLTKNQRRAIVTGSAIVAGALVAYGGYKLYQYRDLISEGKRASSNWNPSSSIKLNTFEPERFKPGTFEPDKFEPDKFEPTRFEPTKHEHTFTSDTHKQVRGTVDRYLKALGTLGEENRPAREFIVKMAKNLDQLTDKETITNKDIAKLAEKAQNYRSLLPNTEASDLLYRDTLYDLMNLMRDRNR